MEHIRVAKVERVGILPSGWPIASTSSRKEPEQERFGTLHLTPHHLIFAYDEPQSGEEAELWIPHPLLSNVTLHPPTHAAIIPLVVRTRTFSVYTFLFRSHTKASDVWESVKAIVHATTTLTSLYSFAHSPSNESIDSLSTQKAWSLYDPKAELARMGAISSTDKARSDAWRWTDVNATYEFCSTYPAMLAVPAKISDVTLRYGKSYRSKARVPALVYLHWANQGSITRSSQPMVGLKNARSIQDEKLIEAIFHSHTQHSVNDSPTNAVYGAKAANLIIDARPTTNAVANSVKGAGTENMEHYKDCKKAYLGIDNIHVMRQSLQILTDALRDSESTGQLDRQALKRSGWLRHLSAILEGAVLIAKNVHIANSHVLIHCSDGWDRTAQLSAMSQICLDPFYRTIKGFAILIEKDWLSFGHKFSHRAGHLVPDRTQFVELHSDSQSTQATILASVQKNLAFSSSAFKETSPVFHQFLDCVYQMCRQYPKRFEFGSHFLQTLYCHLYSCQFGTFLYNSECERKTGFPRPAETTRSIWEIIFNADGSPNAKFLNNEYDVKLDDPQNRSLDADQGVLLPDPHKVVFWHELFQKTEDDFHSLENTDSPPEVIEVNSSGEDPVVAVIDNGLVENVTSALPKTLNLSSANPPVPSPSSAPFGSSPNGQAQVQLQSAVQSVLRFGGSSWKTLRQTVQETVKEYSTPGPTPTGRFSQEAQMATGSYKSSIPNENRSAAASSRPSSDPPSRPASPKRLDGPRRQIDDTAKLAANGSSVNPWTTSQQQQPIVINPELSRDDLPVSNLDIPAENIDPLGVGY